MGNATCCQDVVLSFSCLVERSLFNGSVTATLRSRRIVDPGDRIRARNLALVLLVDSVEPIRIQDLKPCHLRMMGYPTRLLFRMEWKSLHPYTGDDASRVAYLIRFHRVTTPEERRSV